MTERVEQFEIEATAIGFEEAARDVKKLTEAKDELGRPDAKPAQALKGMAEAQGELNTGADTYVALITRVNPLLGALVDSMVKGARIAGDFANQQINLTAAWGRATSAIRANWNALKLFGAAGVVTIGIWAIVKAVQALREAHAKAEEAAKSHQKANEDFVRSASEQAERIAAAQAKEKYRLPFTFEQEQSVRMTLEAVPETMREGLDPILQALGGAKGFGPGAGEFEAGEQKMLQRLGWQPPVDVPMEVSANLARAEFERKADARKIIEKRLLDRQAWKEQQTVAELHGGGSEQGYSQLQAQIEPLAKQFGFDPVEFQKDFITFAKHRQKAERMVASGGIGPGPMMTRTGAMVPPEMYQRDISMTGPLGQPRMPEADILGRYSSGEMLAAQQLEKRLAPHITIVQHNGRYFGTPAEVAKQTATNGETQGRDFE